MVGPPGGQHDADLDEARLAQIQRLAQALRIVDRRGQAHVGHGVATHRLRGPKVAQAPRQVANHLVAGQGPEP